MPDKNELPYIKSKIGPFLKEVFAVLNRNRSLLYSLSTKDYVNIYNIKDVRKQLIMVLDLLNDNAIISVSMFRDFPDFDNWYFEQIPYPETANKKMVLRREKTNYFTQIKKHYLFDVFSQFESKVRILVRHLNNVPTKHGKILKGGEPFGQIVNCFLNNYCQFSKNEVEGLYLFMEIRNAIHNNGISINEHDPKDKEMQFNGKMYPISYKGVINILTWGLVGELIIDIYKVINILYQVPMIKQYSEIIDPIMLVKGPEIFLSNESK